MVPVWAHSVAHWHRITDLMRQILSVISSPSPRLRATVTGLQWHGASKQLKLPLGSRDVQVSRPALITLHSRKNAFGISSRLVSTINLLVVG
jgi:hypothetical protein